MCYKLRKHEDSIGEISAINFSSADRFSVPVSDQKGIGALCNCPINNSN